MSLISLVLAPAYVGLLGVVPVLLGIKKLFDLRRGNGHDEETRPHQTRGGALGEIASVAGVTVANCGDNIGIYTPLFATQNAFEITVTVSVFTVMTGLCHRDLGAPIRRYGHLAVPFVLIGLGLFILYVAGSFELLR
jgi:cadmium resistance protein CadD (predicted permease)